MKNMSDTQVLDKVALLRLAFEGLEDSELEEMASLTQLCSYPPDHILCLEGAYEEIFYIIASGDLLITKHISEQEGERTLRTVGRGDWVGEMALIQNAPRAATVRALTECTVLEMSKHNFETMLTRSPRMAINIIRTTLDRMRENDQMAIRDLQRTNKVLRQLDRNKLEFIQVAAHELRTPLTVIKGYVNVLRSLSDMKANPVLGEVLDGVCKGADRMHEVVNLMLDVTRIDNETLKVVAVPVPIKQLVNDSVHDLLSAAQERRIEIAIEHDNRAEYIYADPSLIQKAVQQMVINAIKYTPDGGKITVSTRLVTMENGSPGVPAVEIAVKDTGIGLDPEHQELVFEKFYQVGSVEIHSSGRTTFKGGGPGLGLAIVRGVARAHGGKAWAESLGHDEVNLPGSTFYLLLPVEVPKTDSSHD